MVVRAMALRLGSSEAVQVQAQAVIRSSTVAVARSVSVVRHRRRLSSGAAVSEVEVVAILVSSTAAVVVVIRSRADNLVVVVIRNSRTVVVALVVALVVVVIHSSRTAVVAVVVGQLLVQAVMGNNRLGNTAGKAMDSSRSTVVRRLVPQVQQVRPVQPTAGRPDRLRHSPGLVGRIRLVAFSE